MSTSYYLLDFQRQDRTAQPHVSGGAAEST